MIAALAVTVTTVGAAPIVGPDTGVAGTEVVLHTSPAGTWWRRQAVPDAYDNIRHCGAPHRGCAQPLIYTWEHVGEGPSLSPALTPGTHAYAVTGGEPPPVDAPVHIVAVRRDDTYVGLLHELLGVPFVFAPAWLEDGHQTDNRVATDCVSLVIYGQRRLGRQIPYVSPHKLYTWLDPVDDLPLLEGDVLHWGWQTAVVAEDRAPLGILDGNDLLVIAFAGVAETRPLGTLPLAALPSARMRWPTRTDMEQATASP